jgi:nucleotide-binding universal stress UspA family protein
MYDAILIPTDGSDGTDRAITHALDLAETYDATLHALAVTDKRIRLAASDENREDVAETLRANAEDAVAAVAERAGDLPVETAIRDGVPYREIVEYADEHAIDLVVIGTHGRTGRERHTNLGSVTERVVEHADRPVLVVDIAAAED